MTADSASFPMEVYMGEENKEERHQLLIHAGKGQTKTVVPKSEDPERVRGSSSAV